LYFISFEVKRNEAKKNLCRKNDWPTQGHHSPLFRLALAFFPPAVGKLRNYQYNKIRKKGFKEKALRVTKKLPPSGGGPYMYYIFYVIELAGGCFNLLNLKYTPWPK